MHSTVSTAARQQTLSVKLNIESGWLWIFDICWYCLTNNYYLHQATFNDTLSSFDHKGGGDGYERWEIQLLLIDRDICYFAILCCTCFHKPLIKSPSTEICRRCGSLWKVFIFEKRARAKCKTKHDITLPPTTRPGHSLALKTLKWV